MSVVTEKSTYKHIVKSTSLFGGVQVIQIIATIIRGKFVAIFLGTTGMGISSLLVSSIAMIQTISGLGLNYSAVREISKAKETEDSYKISRTIKIYYRWLLFSGAFGAVLLFFLAPFLSNFVFGNSEYTFEFILLSVVIFISIVGNGYNTLLQGMRRLSDLAKATVIGSILSVLITVPIYYFFKISGIVPALIAAALVSLIINYFFAKKINLTSLTISKRETIGEGGEMVKLGVIMMITGLMGTLTIFLINTFIKKYGSLSDVGLYQAGNSLTNQSIGLVFTAMGVDYFPRLSAVSTDSQKVRNLANQQAEIMLLIVTPLLLLLILTAPLLIRILLSKEFLPITNFIRLISLGMFFQAANYAMGLISYAKGDKRTFLMLGVVGNFLWLFFSVLGYILNGLLGMAMLFVVHSVVCYFIVYFTAFKKYNYLMSKSFTKLFISGFFTILIMCSLVMLLPNLFGYSLSCMIFCLSSVYSVYHLNKLIGLKQSVFLFLNRFKK